MRNIIIDTAILDRLNIYIIGITDYFTLYFNLPYIILEIKNDFSCTTIVN